MSSVQPRLILDHLREKSGMERRFKAFEPGGLGFAERNFKRFKSERNGRFFRGLLSVIILVLRRSERQDLTTVRELLNGSGECL